MSIKIINNYVLGALLSMLPLELNSFIYDKDTFNSNIVENSVGKKNTSKSIAVKIGVGTKYYTSQLNAEKSLDSLCRDRNTVLEDAWMFHNNILTDIGLYEDKTSVTLYLSVNDSVYSYAQGDTLTLYHIHPDPYNKKIFSPPSITDIINNAQLKQSIPNKINVIEKIFDGMLKPR